MVPIKPADILFVIIGFVWRLLIYHVPNIRPSVDIMVMVVVVVVVVNGVRWNAVVATIPISIVNFHR